MVLRRIRGSQTSGQEEERPGSLAKDQALNELHTPSEPFGLPSVRKVGGLVELASAVAQLLHSSQA